LEIEFKLKEAELYAINWNKYFESIINKFTSIKYYYLEYSNHIPGGFKDGENNNKYKIKNICSDNGNPIELVGEEIYNENLSIVHQKVKFDNGEIQNILLEDNSKIDENKKIGIKYGLFSNGTKCKLYDIKLV